MRGLKYISWADTTGYGIAAKSYLRALIDVGVKLTWTPMLTSKGLYEELHVTDWHCPKLATVCNKPLDYDTVLIHTVPEYFPKVIDREKRNGRRIIGYTVWELEELPERWSPILNRLDGVIVPCSWNLEVFRRSGVKVPIHVVPHMSQFEDIQTISGNDRSKFMARLGQESCLDGRFVFYSIGFWSNRKAPYLALQAYWSAFQATDPVFMILKTSKNDITRWHRSWKKGFKLCHPSPKSAVRELAKKFSDPAPVALIADETLSDSEMMVLHETGDCFVSLARAEGWGLGIFDAARLGKPVITTAHGGQMDFLRGGLSRFVDYLMEPVNEPVWSANYRPTDKWANPIVDQAIQHMREVFKNKESESEKARLLSASIKKDFSREVVIKLLLKALG